MKYIIPVVAVILVSCRTTLKVPSSDPFLEVRTTACFGECPIYKLKIYDNRMAQFDGEFYVKKKGEWLKRIPQVEMDSLKLLIDNSKFFDLESSYDNPGISDLPSFYLTVNSGNKSKTIHCRYDVPEALLEIYQYANRIRSSNGWNKVEQ